jgi:hypothetical protein
VLGYKARELSGLLVQIPLGIAPQDPQAESLIGQGGPAWELWQAIHGIRPRPGDNQLGSVAAGKLLARKRPHLIPVYDSRVKEVLRRPGNDLLWWRDLRCQLIKARPRA